MKKLFFIIVLALVKLLAWAEDTTTTITTTIKPVVRSESRFLRPRNFMLFALDAAAISADGYTTQRMFSQGWREVNPIARPFGKSRTATAGLCSFGLAATVWGSWEAHRRGWRRMEWVIPLAVAGAEAVVAAHNTGAGLGGR